MDLGLRRAAQPGVSRAHAGVRRIGALRLVEPQVARLLRARCVEDSARFVARDLRGRGVYGYALRGGGATVVLEHGTPDVLVLDELFYQNVYRTPPAVEERMRALGPAPVAVDLGANVGMWAAWLHRRAPQATITLFEPDPRNIEMLRRTIAANGRQDAWTVVDGPATATGGPVLFAGGGYAESHLAAPDEPGGIEVQGRDALPAIMEADIVKIDIEGGEGPILSDPRLRESRARVLVLEYHPGGLLGSDPERVAHQLLARAGFEVLTVNRTPVGTGNLWAWRSS